MDTFSAGVLNHKQEGKGKKLTRFPFLKDWHSVSDYATFMSKILTEICFRLGKCGLDGFISLMGVERMIICFRYTNFESVTASKTITSITIIK